MAMTTISPVTEKFIDKCDPEDPEYQRDLIRPVEIKEDVKLMEQRKRVSIILKSKTFRKELEDVIRRQCTNAGISESSASLLSVNHISEQLLLAAIPKKTTSAIGVGVSTNGIIPINDLRDGLLKVYGQNERQVRCKVAAIHRLMDMFSWCGGSSHYITARVSKDGDEFLIKPFGLFFHEITASCLITIDGKGNVKHPGSTVLSNDLSYWSLHSAIHTIRTDISCLIFLRTPAALCVSGSNQGFLPISSESIMLGKVGSFIPQLDSNDFDTPSGFCKLQSDIYQVFDTQKKVLLIPNHGIFVGGVSVEEAWFLVQRVQTACEVQELLCKLDMTEIILPEEEIIKGMENVWLQFSEASIAEDKSDDKQFSQLYLQKYRIGLLEFEAMMRHLDNSGYRTGYLYQTVNVYKSGGVEDGDTHVSKYPDVEIPPSCSSLKQSMSTGNAGRQRSFQQDQVWFNTPNVYKLDETFNFEPLLNGDLIQSISSSPERRKARWISANCQENATSIPHHPVTPGAHITILSAASSSAPGTPSKSTLKGIDPKELKDKQKKVKDKYYFDTNTAGPQSTLLDGLTWEEARRVREEGLTKFLGKSPGYGDEPLITAASKGIIQRDHKHHALVLENVFKPSNPFDKVTDDDLVKYKEEVNRKMHPELYKVTEIVKSKSDPELISPTKTEAECSIPELPSIPQDISVPNLSSKVMDQGMTSDSDYPGDSSIAMTAQESIIHGTITSETSAADLSHDDVEKEGKPSKDKKKRKSFKSIFSKKKKKEEKK